MRCSTPRPCADAADGSPHLGHFFSYFTIESNILACAVLLGGASPIPDSPGWSNGASGRDALHHHHRDRLRRAAGASGRRAHRGVGQRRAAPRRPAGDDPRLDPVRSLAAHVPLDRAELARRAARVPRLFAHPRTDRALVPVSVSGPQAQGRLRARRADLCGAGDRDGAARAADQLDRRSAIGGLGPALQRERPAADSTRGQRRDRRPAGGVRDAAGAQRRQPVHDSRLSPRGRGDPRDARCRSTSSCAAGRVRELRGVGSGIEARLRELLETGEIAELAELERELSPGPGRPAALPRR